MATNGEDSTPLLGNDGVGMRKRGPVSSNKTETRYQPPAEDWNPNLPYGGKVYLARRKKPDPLWCTILEVLVLIGTFLFALYAYYYFDHLHFHVTHGYAHLGFPSAQHQVGQKLLNGKGVEKDSHLAMEWFKKAADQGHPHASYNLAVGHLQGIRTDLLERGDPHKLIAHAASKGVKEAHKALNDVCAKGGCE